MVVQIKKHGNKDKHFTIEHKKKLSDSKIGKRNPNFGKHTWNTGTKGIMKPNKTSFKKGEHASIKTEFKKGQGGEKHYNWQGGKSFEPYSLDWTNTLRQSIRERDHYICQLCNKPQTDRLHSIHHIDYNKLNCNPNNLITLCLGCNTKVNHNRDYWTNYFNKLKQ